jgi:septum formation protein
VPAIHRLGVDFIHGDESLGGCAAIGDKHAIEAVHRFALRRRRRFSTRLFMGLILASSSAIRRAMLQAAGVAHEVVAAGIDEDALKNGADGGPVDLAQRLADAKALAVSETHPRDWVIGSDSLVCAGGRRFDKPADHDQAAEHLRYFSGKTMELTSAVALAQGGSVEWRHAETARLQVRALSDAFIADYLAAEWPEVGYCVGVFRLEARGVQLFDSIDGDHFTVLGMPLLPLLGALRARGLVPA